MYSLYLFQFFSFSLCVSRFGSHASPLFPCELIRVCAVGPTDKALPLLGHSWRLVMYIWGVASTGCREAACSCIECSKWPISVLWWLCTSAWLWYFAVLKCPVSSQCLSAWLWQSAAHRCAVNAQVPIYDTLQWCIGQSVFSFIAMTLHYAEWAVNDWVPGNSIAQCWPQKASVWE